MNDPVIGALLAINGIASVVCGYFTLCAINAMGRSTSLPVRLGYLVKGVGLFALFLSAFDYWHEQAAAWPWFFLFGVTSTLIGEALIYIAVYAKCGCPHCASAIKESRRPMMFWHRRQG